jgi:hypothetical protein
MENRFLQCSTTVLFAMIMLGANGQNWLIDGNSNTSATNFIGTRNAQPIIFKTSNTERLRITKNGLVGIGINGNLEAFQVNTSSFNTAIFASTSHQAEMH